MQFLLDHIAAVVITGFIILIIGAVSFRGQTASIDSTQYFAQKRMLLDLVQMAERDFTNIGSGGTPPGTAIISFDTSGTVKEFTFRARPDSIAVPNFILTPPSTIAYEWQEVGTLNLTTGSAKAYTVERKVDGVVAGRSTGYITSFDIDFFAAGGTSVAATADSMRVIRLDVTAVSPLGRGNNIEQSRWT
ncbi:MAG: hypothetical protein R3178_05305, partial [Rhodothermales bacterium]|nr:hypothetical protein [Rhodothermales bacterium]